MRLFSIMTTGLALAGLSTMAQAAGFGHEQSYQIDGQALKVADTSARILGNEAGDTPLLVDDITDGLGKQPVPGYKIMIMSRAYSLAADARPARDGSGWSDNRYIHRGTKLVIGIPVRNGQMKLEQAQLIGFAAISDAGAGDTFKAEDKIRPRGEQLLKKDTQVRQPQLQLQALSLPDMRSGERSGGGVRLQAAVTLDDRQIQTRINSTFTEFQVAKPGSARGFNADARFINR